MGIGPTALTLYGELVRRGLLKSGQRILELGSQKLYLSQWRGMASRFANALGLKLDETDLVSSRDLMEALGFDYTSIDPDGQYGAHKMDLNLPQCILDPYDVVTNHGDSEHIFNQLAFFKTTHDATKVGGLMIHCVPMRGFDDHCFYLYKPELFETMAQANNYSVVGIWISEDEATTLRAPSALREISGNVLLSAVFTKTTKAEFAMPNQWNYQRFIHA